MPFNLETEETRSAAGDNAPKGRKGTVFSARRLLREALNVRARVTAWNSVASGSGGKLWPAFFTARCPVRGKSARTLMVARVGAGYFTDTVHLMSTS